MSSYDIKGILDQLNVVARTEFNRGFQSLKPTIEGLLHEYNSGAVDTLQFPFFEFFSGMQKFTGDVEFESYPKAFLHSVQNEEWSDGLIIPRRELERARGAGIQSLSLYMNRIADFPRVANEHPYELAIDMIEVGDADTYGTCFDGQKLFDTTHDYSDSAGTQSNIVTGTGTTAANIIADLNSAYAAMRGFYYQQGGTSNAKKRQLNKKYKFLVLCPTQLAATFDQIQNQERLATGESNPWYKRFEFVDRTFTDTNDYYLLNLDNSDRLSLLLFQKETPLELTYPSINDESFKYQKIAKWSAYSRYNVAYGAWWKGVQITNS